MHRALCTLLFTAGLLAAAASHATAYGVDQTDLWGAPGESGWGIQLQQQHDTIFATMFVYGADNQPAWYIATLLPTGTPFQYSGNVLATNGPYFGATWNPAQVTGSTVGTMVFTAPQVASAALNYTINGVTVAKTITRSTFVNNNVSGIFLGAVNLGTVGGNCAARPFGLGVQAAFVVNPPDDQGHIPFGFTAQTDELCRVDVGQAQQTGQYSRLSGTFTCDGGDTGTLTVTEINAAYTTLSARIDYYSNGPGACHAQGNFAGVRVSGALGP